MNLTIKATSDYDKFLFLKGNRNINTSHLANITSSILKKNLLHLNPIVVNSKFEVIDGQHRLLAAKNLKMPIYYIIASDISLEEVRILNKYTKTWNALTFLDSYAGLGNDDYIWLREFMQGNNISLSIAAILLGVRRWSLGNPIKSGNMRLSAHQREQGDKRATMLNTLRQNISIKGHLPTYFVYAFVELIEKGKGDKVLEGVENAHVIFTPEREYSRARIQLAKFL